MQKSKVFFAWFILNIFSAAVFASVALREMSLRDFPDHHPFDIYMPVDRFSDLFVPMIDFPLVIFGIMSALIIFVATRRFWARHSRFVRYLVAGSCVFLTILAGGFGILLVNALAESVECGLSTGGLFGCWRIPNPQGWHWVMCIVWSIGVVISAFWGRRKFVL